jgi:hypothetical protein
LTAATAAFPGRPAIRISVPSTPARKRKPSLASKPGKDIAYHLSGSFVSACDLSSALGRLFSAVAQGQVKPKTASTLAYLGQTLVQALPLAQHEYVNAYGTDSWRKTIRTSHEQSANHTSPDADADSDADADADDETSPTPEPEPVTAPTSATPSDASPTPIRTESNPR